MTLAYNDGEVGDREGDDNSAQSNSLARDDSYVHQGCSLHPSPRMSLGGDEIPMGLGSLQADLPGSLGVVWDDANMDVPVNLSENQVKLEMGQVRIMRGLKGLIIETTNQVQRPKIVKNCITLATYQSCIFW